MKFNFFLSITLMVIANSALASEKVSLKIERSLEINETVVETYAVKTLDADLSKKSIVSLPLQLNVENCGISLRISKASTETNRKFTVSILADTATENNIIPTENLTFHTDDLNSLGDVTFKTNLQGSSSVCVYKITNISK